jgi:hypothetical protein
MKKRWRATAVQDAGALTGAERTARSVMECASPLALCAAVRKVLGGFASGRLYVKSCRESGQRSLAAHYFKYRYSSLGGVQDQISLAHPASPMPSEIIISLPVQTAECFTRQAGARGVVATGIQVLDFES